MASRGYRSCRTYTDPIRQSAVAMVRAGTPISAVAETLGIPRRSVVNWVKRAEDAWCGTATTGLADDVTIPLVLTPSKYSGRSVDIIGSSVAGERCSLSMTRTRSTWQSSKSGGAPGTTQLSSNLCELADPVREQTSRSFCPMQ